MIPAGRWRAETNTKVALESFGLVEGANNRPASFVVEKAFGSAEWQMRMI